MNADPSRGEVMINFRSVTKTYPDGTTAVDSLDLEIPTGRLTAFVGPSGCGKTTTLRMINRMVEPTSGTVSVDGVDVTSVDAAVLRRRIGYVIQDVGLFPHRTVADNVATVPTLLGRSRRQARTAALELLERVGLPASIGRRYPAQLSGGQQQRVGVARALAADPPLLLMDEPFSAVDPVVRVQLQDEMARLQAEIGKTIVFVTHDVDEALRLGDLIAVFAPGGRLAQLAEPSSLLQSPADDFVADFIGRDRGYRALSFTAAPDLPVSTAVSLSWEAISAAIAGICAAPSPPPGDRPWALLVDERRAPRGWLDVRGLRAGRGPTTADVRLGGTLIGPGASLRSALDATLSSPSGDGVLVDAGGLLVGVVSAAEVIAAIEAARRTAAGPAAETAGP